MAPRVWLNCLLLCGNLVFPIQGTSGEEWGDVFESLEAPWITEREGGKDEGEEDHLETDRDSFTPATTTVAFRRVLFESAYSFIKNRDTDHSHSYPEIVTRFGLTERLELRLGWNFETGGGGSVSSGDAGGELEEPGSREESQLLYGFKYALTKQDAWMPQSACIIQATTPTSGLETFSDFQLGYVFGWEIFEDWQLDSCLRYVSTKEEADHFNQWAPSVVLKIPVAEKWNVHGEYFGIFTDGRAESRNPQYFSPGLHYLVSPDCEIGVRVGWGLNQDAANFFANVGCGLRF